MRDVQSAPNGLPPRTPEMLYNIVRKFYRGAVSHYDLIQAKKAEAAAARQECRAGGDDAALKRALHTLFLEFHFYVTCWLKIEQALVRLASQDGRQAAVLERFRPELERHLGVRELLDKTEACVKAQLAHGGPDWPCVQQDEYWFAGIAFTVDEHSLQALHDLYEAIQRARNEVE